MFSKNTFLEYMALLIEHPKYTIPQIMLEYTSKYGVSVVSEWTLWKWRRRFLQKCYFVRTPPLSSKSVHERANFGSWVTRKRFERIFFTDEKWFVVKTDSHGYLRRGCYLVDKQHVARFLPRSGKVERLQIWAGISYYDGATPPYLTRGSVKHNTYIRILEDMVDGLYGEKFRDASLWYQHDNAKVHTAEAVGEAIKKMGWKTFYWPAFSCDWSPIEFFWALVVQELDRFWCPRNLSELKVALSYIWPKLTQPEVLQACYDRAMHNIELSADVGWTNFYIRAEKRVRRSIWEAEARGASEQP